LQEQEEELIRQAIEASKQEAQKSGAAGVGRGKSIIAQANDPSAPVT